MGGWGRDSQLETGPYEQEPTTTCGDIKSQLLSLHSERKTSEVGRIQLSKHQSLYLAFTMLLIEIKNALVLAGMNLWPWETLRKQQSNTSGPQQEAPDKGPAEKTEI